MFCVDFTVDQYHNIFKSRFYNQKTVFTSLVNSAIRWKNRNNNCDKSKFGKGWSDYHLPAEVDHITKCCTGTKCN